MNESQKLISEVELDQLMTQVGLKPALDFEHKVIRLMENSAADSAHREVPQSLAAHFFKPLRWLALLSGGAFALSELLAFMFGLWTVSTAL